MEKSEFLDELRLEVGLAYDYAKNKDDFLQKVLRAIHSFIAKSVDSFILVYEVLENEKIQVKHIIGKETLKKQDHFGLGFVSLATMRGTVLLEQKENQVLLVPIHEEDKLKYVIKLHINNFLYTFTKQDVDFLIEVIRFIELRQKTFLKDDKNK